MVINLRHMLHPTNSLLLAAMALSLSLLAGCDSASNRINELQQQVWQEPDNPEAYIRLANAQAHQQRYDEAVGSYEKALQLDPDSGERVYPALGAVAFNRKEFTEALEFFRKSLEFSPRDSLRLYDIGNVYLQLEQYDSAIVAYQKAIQNSLAFEEANYNLAIAYIRNGQREKAVDIYSWLQEKNNYLAVSLERHLYPEGTRE
ncbi:MAG: tetratricopeptide repeat protein [Prosthecochloris sp.]|nr:tetratricopeptide repeat protein [Prosthecochloris sp.]